MATLFPWVKQQSISDLSDREKDKPFPICQNPLTVKLIRAIFGRVKTEPIIIGGGAAGFFGAIACAEANHNARPILLEKGSQLLTKVRISGGGRCNVTHACFDPSLLIGYYPRGGKPLRGPFSRFQPRDTIRWFESRGVELKTEPDGRMFPVTNSSQTIIDCLVKAAAEAGVQVRTGVSVEGVERHENGFTLRISGRESLNCEHLLIATGNSRGVWQWLEALGHTIMPPVPSLFTFNIPTSPLKELSGVSVDQVQVTIADTDLKQTGPLLITHWGFSGPAILKLSAWGARELHAREYKATVRINWLPAFNEEELRRALASQRDEHPNKLVATDSPVPLPKSLWRALLPFEAERRWGAVSNKEMHPWIQRLRSDAYQIDGKTTNKEEFVTCGGVSLDEVDFKTMESRICPGLYLAGEVLDIDGVTGGFNFQAAWTTGYIAGISMQKLL